jgi:mono/diheme cytochrome c family protein
VSRIGTLATTIALPAALALASLTGCREQTSDETPIAPERNMYDTERFNPESYSDFFPDHRTMRLPVPGTLARDHYEDDPEVATGLLPDRSGYAMTIPQGIVQRQGGMEKMLALGQSRFAIYCAPCHGLTGDGKGMVVCKRDKGTGPCTDTRGFPPLPSYEDPRLRAMPDGQLFATITHGARTMPAYGPQIPVGDRWAIVAYVRALQVSQMAAVTPQPEPKK